MCQYPLHATFFIGQHDCFETAARRRTKGKHFTVLDISFGIV